MTADVDCVPLDLSLNSKYKFENYMSEDESSEYNSDQNMESEDPEKPKDLKSTKAYKKNLIKRYRKLIFSILEYGPVVA